ncbi:MAG: DUF5615 family PIN-like protein [Rubrobacter sp.]|nr:DUF5615 family PIN-like protein [Rubrobacter sp.]
MRLLLDAHISGSRVGGALRVSGHDVKATEKLERVPDVVLLEMATQEGRVLVTHNAKDFLRILKERAPEKSHAGLVLIPSSIKLNDFGAIISGIHGTVSVLSQEEWVDRVEWMKREKTS